MNQSSIESSFDASLSEDDEDSEADDYVTFKEFKEFKDLAKNQIQ